MTDTATNTTEVSTDTQASETSAELNNPDSFVSPATLEKAQKESAPGNSPGSSASATPGTPAADATAPVEAAVAPKVFTILLVEDDDATRIALAYILDTHGFKVEQARHGQDAVNITGTHAFDVVLMDVEMPVMDGISALALLRRGPLTRETPVLMLSKQASRDQVRKAVSLGAKDFIVKQVLNIPQLIEKLRKAIETAQNPRPHAAPAHSSTSATAKPPAATENTTAQPTNKTAAPAPGSTPASPPGNAAGTPAAAPAVNDDTPIDQRLWKEKMEAIGRLDRDKCKAFLEKTELPAVFSSLRGEVIMGLKAGPSAAEDVVRAVEQDPAMVIEMLDHANRNQDSQAQALDIDTTIHWIGRSSIEELLKDNHSMRVKINPKLRPWLLRWWRHSMAVGQIAAELAPFVKQKPAVIRLAGLLHDIGRLQMLTSSELSEKLVTCYELGSRMTIGTTYAEQTLLGTTHKQAGVEFCTRHHVPADLARICDTHDVDDAARERLDDSSAAFSALIFAAEQIAKSAGYGSLPNEEIYTIPAVMQQVVKDNATRIENAVAEIETLCLWRIGSEKMPPMDPPLKITGTTILFVSPSHGPWNPFQKTFTNAGAAVTSFATIKDLLDSRGMADMIIIDCTDTNLSLGMPMLRRLNDTASYKQIPKLLMARRADEPEDRASQAMLSMSIYPTPIRQHTLLSTIARLTKS